MPPTQSNRPLASDILYSSLPGPSRKRTPSPYCYRLIHRNPDPGEPGCMLLWEVFGGRQPYQIALEREESGHLRYHCTCADFVYRAENSNHLCKHIRGLQALGRDLLPTSPGR
jgi:hypothetical protein